MHLVVFTYNNRYQASLEINPFEALYGRKCNTPVSWDNPIDRATVGPYLLKEMKEQVTKIRHNLKVAQDRYKSYANKNISNKEFKIYDRLFLRVNIWKISLKLGHCAKLTTRYCGPIEILEMISLVSYSIALPIYMHIHNVFHISLLKKYVPNAHHVFDWKIIQMGFDKEFQVQLM